MVVVAAHTPCWGEPLLDDERRRVHSLAWPNTKERGKHHMQPLCNACRVSHGVPKPARYSFRRFAFRFTAPWGAQYRRVVASSVSHCASLPLRLLGFMMCTTLIAQKESKGPSLAFIMGKHCRAGEVLKKKEHKEELWKNIWASIKRNERKHTHRVCTAHHTACCVSLTDPIAQNIPQSPAAT